MNIAGNTTYDASFQYRQFVRDVQTTVKQWGRLPPAYPLLASATKGWQDRLNSLHNFTELRTPQTQRAQKALEEAWFNRDNRTKALKSLGDALDYLTQGVKALDGQVAAGQRPHYGTMKAVMQFDNPTENRQEWANELLRNWVYMTQQSLSQIDTVATKSVNGLHYRQGAYRLKSWLDQNHQVYGLMTQKAISAVESIDGCVNEILDLARANILDNGAHRSIKSAIRNAMIHLDQVAIKSYGQTEYNEPLREIANLRGQVDRLIPLLESEDMNQDVAFKSLSQIMDQTRSLGYMLPTRKLSMQAIGNYDNAGAALAMAIQNAQPAVRIKSLMAVAANLDTLAVAIEQVDGEIVVNE